MEEHQYDWEQNGFVRDREELTQFFLPENTHTRACWSDEMDEAVAKALLGAEKTDKHLCSLFDKTPEEDPQQYLEDKCREFAGVYYRYSRIFDFCRVLGISHVYDIGCQWINQAFLLVPYSVMQYTGIGCSFSLLNWRKEHHTAEHCAVPCVHDAPPSFCDGRIRFQKGWYPDIALSPEDDSIAVACYAFTMCREPEEIARTCAALRKDFNRILFNLNYFSENDPSTDCWKEQDWHGYTIFPIGPCGFVYATRVPEDVERLKAVYPCDEMGRFFTGIDDGMLHFEGYYLNPHCDEFYLNWFYKGID
jgi:hypothetical protein